VQILLILNDAPYGTERCYNGLRVALALAKSEPTTAITVFLMAMPGCGKDGPEDPHRLLQCRAHAKGSGCRQGQILLCARVWMHAALLTPRCCGARRSNMAELATLTLAADKSGVLNKR